MMNKSLRLALLGGLLAAPILWSAPAAAAGSLSLTLTRTTLANVTDSVGLNQYEAGTVSAVGGTAIGYYQILRRVTTGVDLNTAAEHLTLLFANPGIGNPPYSVTLDGAHSFNSGGFTGSVSATSPHQSWLRGADATATSTGTTTTLTLQWTGAAYLTLP